MYAEKQQEKMDFLDKGLKKVERQAQKNMNARLDHMRFRDYTRSEFNSTAPHAGTDISFVLENDQSISLYKGDTQLSSQGSGVDVLYSALVGYGTGLGGERTGQGELVYSQNTSYRDVIETSDPDDIFGYYNQTMSFWVNVYGTTWGYTGALRPTNAYVKGLGDFKSSAQDITTPIIVNRTKAVVSSNVRNTEGYRVWDPPSGTSLLYTKSFYIRRVLEDGYGPRETLTFTVEPYGFHYTGNSSTRVVTNYSPTWKIKVSNGTNERYLTGVYTSDYSAYMVADSGVGLFPNAGFLLGFTSIQHTDDDILYGQLRGPALLWRGFLTVEETPQNPYGFQYDIASGDPLDEPTVEFYNEDERNMAYCLCLPRRIDI